MALRTAATAASIASALRPSKHSLVENSSCGGEGILFTWGICGFAWEFAGSLGNLRVRLGICRADSEDSKDSTFEIVQYFQTIQYSG